MNWPIRDATAKRFHYSNHRRIREARRKSAELCTVLVYRHLRSGAPRGGPGNLEQHPIPWNRFAVPRDG